MLPLKHTCLRSSERFSVGRLPAYSLNGNWPGCLFFVDHRVGGPRFGGFHEFASLLVCEALPQTGENIAENAEAE
jgi:hypothetical protein